jgi:hypothetical protein
MSFGLPVSGYAKKVTEFTRRLLDEYGSVSTNRKSGHHTAIWMESQPVPVPTIAAIIDLSTDCAYLLGYTPALNAMAQMVLVAICPAFTLQT